jgi:Domain of unknown function (DUF4360)
MRKLSLALLTALLATACSAPPEAQAPVAPLTAKAVAAAPVGAGSIESVEYVGTGCNEKTATSGFSPDKQVVTSIFSDFIASTGPGNAPEDATRNCLMTLRINVPDGWRYSLESVDYRGFANLEGDVAASRRSLYVIMGSLGQLTPPARWEGEASGDYNQADVGSGDPKVWSPCGHGQVLNIGTEIEVSNGGRASQSGLLTVDTIDTELQWETCPMKE